MAAHPVPYSPRLNENERNQFKDTYIRTHPDILFEDYKHGNERCNLIFFTNFKEAWRDAIMQHYPMTTRTDLEDKIKLNIQRGYVCVYPNGKFVIQARPTDLTEFENNFAQLHEEMEAIRNGIN